MGIEHPQSCKIRLWNSCNAVKPSVGSFCRGRYFQLPLSLGLSDQMFALVVVYSTEDHRSIHVTYFGTLLDSFKAKLYMDNASQSAPESEL